MAGGRPTDYREEFCEQIVKFFSIDPVAVVPGVDRDGNPKDILVPNRFPTFERFATNIGVTTKTLQRWAEDKNEDGSPKHPEFCLAYAQAKDLQGANLMEGGMGGTYAGSFTVVAAKNLIGWRDKQDHEISGKDGAPIETKTTIDASAVEAALSAKFSKFVTPGG